VFDCAFAPKIATPPATNTANIPTINAGIFFFIPVIALASVGVFKV
jgi:hypothetical protein